MNFFQFGVLAFLQGLYKFFHLYFPSNFFFTLCILQTHSVMYIISGQGRKSSVARATEATASLAPLIICIICYLIVFLFSNRFSSLSTKETLYFVKSSTYQCFILCFSTLFEIWSSNPSVWPIQFQYRYRQTYRFYQ